MIIKTIEVGTTKTTLKTLLETAGVVFPNDNDTCTKVSLQINADTAETVVVTCAEYPTDEGWTLSNDVMVGPAFLSYTDRHIANTILSASSDTTKVAVLIEQKRG